MLSLISYLTMIMANALNEGKGTAVTNLSQVPLVYLVEGLLSSVECDQLIELGVERLRESQMGSVAHEATLEAHAASTRSSRSTFFDQPADEAHPLLVSLRERWARIVNQSVTHAEHTQLTKYADGAEYGLHLDASDEVQRTATVITYLNDGFEGGETTFPRIASECAHGSGKSEIMRPLAKLAAAGMLTAELGKFHRYCTGERAVLRVSPKKGDSLVFFPMRADGTIENDVVHGGCPVHNGGIKWISQQWFTLEPQPTRPKY